MYVNTKYNHYSEQDNRAMEMAKPLTPLSERPRASYGSLEVSIQMTEGLCQAERKCIRKDNHAGDCWPNTH